MKVVRKAPPKEVDPKYMADKIIEEHAGKQYQSDVDQVGRPELFRRRQA
jgi:hypothetical protein